MFNLLKSLFCDNQQETSHCKCKAKKSEPEEETEYHEFDYSYCKFWSISNKEVGIFIKFNMAFVYTQPIMLVNIHPKEDFDKIFTRHMDAHNKNRHEPFMYPICEKISIYELPEPIVKRINKLLELKPGTYQEYEVAPNE